MQVSPFCKRFKHSQLMGDTFTLPDVRSSIIRTMQGYNQQQNMANLWRLKKQTQIIEIWIQNTDRILTVYDRAYHPLPYADTVIITGHISRPNVSTSHDLIPNYLIVFYGLILNHPYTHIHNYLNTSHGLVNTKPKTYLIIEMVPHLIYYSYATKYHKLSSMFVPGYQCSNIYIDVEKGALMNKDIQ
jgi:hypothetical protein